MAGQPSAPAVPAAMDEIVFRQAFEFGQHSNGILYYFALSPFFDRTSNNAILFQQGQTNQAMSHFLATRELFEGRLRTMSGLEYMVAQEPAETGIGVGTGVWVINKQTRRKRQGEEDEITVHATYFVVGENIYMAPTLADLMSSRMASISSSIADVFPALDEIQKWSPAMGRVYYDPDATGTKEDEEAGTAEPLLPGMASALQPTASGDIDYDDYDDYDDDDGDDGAADPDYKKDSSSSRGGGASKPDARYVDESLMIQEKYGGEYMDENPIVGRPGAFHLNSSGRKVNVSAAAAAAAKQPPAALTLKDTTVLSPLNTAKAAAESPLSSKNGKEAKSPRTPGAPKPKRRKSKIGGTPS